MKSAEVKAHSFILQPPGRLEDADIFHKLIIGEKALARYIEAIRQEQRQECAKAYEIADEKEWDAACLDVVQGDIWRNNVRDAILNAGKEDTP